MKSKLKLISAMKTLFIFTTSILLSLYVNAQELNCQVRVIAPNTQTTDPKVFETLQKSIIEFMNTRHWTGDIYGPQEKIDCSILITISQELSSDKFAAQITVQSSRPTFNSTYNSPIIYILDKDFQFQYAQYQNLIFNDNQYTDNLTSVLAYYAYMILGFDYDSFSASGGTPFFQKANSIVSSAQSASSSGPGWKSYESIRNRFWLVNNMTNAKVDYVHTVFYKYHREGLDNMYDKGEAARKPIVDALVLLNKLKEDAPNAMITQTFLQTKGDELVNIFSKATPQEKSQVVTILTSLDASNATKYQAIMK